MTTSVFKPMTRVAPQAFSHAFIFDLDGVLADTARLHLAAWQTLAAELGLPFGPDMNTRLRGLSRADSLDLVLGPAAANFSAGEKQDLARRKNQAYLDALAGMSHTDLLPGARQALLAVRAGGWGLALASASENAPLVLARLDIAPLFHHVADPAAVKHGKPAPDIFLAAADALRVAPTRCVGIEDAVAGIDAIRAAGMFALGIGDARVLANAHRVLPDLCSFQPGDHLC